MADDGRGPAAGARPRRAARGLEVAVTDWLGRPVRRRPLADWLERVAPRAARGTVAIAIVSDSRIRVLNRRFRRANRVTDVLAFPAGVGDEARARAKPHLGDIVIAEPRAARQARAAGHGVGVELRVLALHGLLHLLGYDHHRDDGRMARAERRLRRAGGLPAGLLERAEGRPRAATASAARQPRRRR